MYSIIQVFEPAKKAWLPSIVHEGKALPKVRELLGGRWSRSSGHLEKDGAAAFWNSDNGRKAFVMAMPKGMPLDAVYRIAEAKP